ncbi:MAG: hypothetical protein JSR86_19865 [Proteobacteria bacterium]|nr:hypothetical protein [Pseudomonadota bacterium]
MRAKLMDELGDDAAPEGGRRVHDQVPKRWILLIEDALEFRSGDGPRVASADHADGSNRADGERYIWVEFG